MWSYNTSNQAVSKVSTNVIHLVLLLLSLVELSWQVRGLCLFPSLWNLKLLLEKFP